MERYIQIAYNEAKKSECSFLFCCVIIGTKGKMKNQILSKGFNRFNETFYQSGKIGSIFTTHAEINTLYKIKKAIIKKFNPIMIVIRKSEINKFSKPCIQCSEKILKYGISKVYYVE